jgi:hypothetical protein
VAQSYAFGLAGRKGPAHGGRGRPNWDGSTTGGLGRGWKGTRLKNARRQGEVTEARILIEGWRKEYYQLRPYSALNYRPPAPEAIMLVGLT